MADLEKDSIVVLYHFDRVGGVSFAGIANSM